MSSPKRQNKFSIFAIKVLFLFLKNIITHIHCIAHFNVKHTMTFIALMMWFVHFFSLHELELDSSFHVSMYNTQFIE